MPLSQTRESMALIQPDCIADQVYTALKAAFSELIKENPEDSFYAFALFTDDSLQFLHAVANTEEALEATVKRYRETVDPKYGSTSTLAGMRWSYGDWEFFPEVGPEYFEEINEVLRAKFMSDEKRSAGDFESLWNAIVRGFQRVEKEGFFGSGSERARMTLLICGDLPDEMVERWVLALNPPEVAERFIHWDSDASEEECSGS